MASKQVKVAVDKLRNDCHQAVNNAKIGYTRNGREMASKQVKVAVGKLRNDCYQAVNNAK